MKMASMIVGAVGALITLMAIIGRCRLAPSVTLPFVGSTHHAGSVLMAATPILLIAILLAILAVCEKK